MRTAGQRDSGTAGQRDGDVGDRLDGPAGIPGRGIAKTAVRMLLELAGEQDRWGLMHAFPAITNAASNAVCRSAGFRFAGEQQTSFAGRLFRTNHWVVNPATD